MINYVYKITLNHFKLSSMVVNEETDNLQTSSMAVNVEFDNSEPSVFIIQSWTIDLNEELDNAHCTVNNNE